MLAVTDVLAVEGVPDALESLEAELPTPENRDEGLRLNVEVAELPVAPAAILVIAEPGRLVLVADRDDATCVGEIVVETPAEVNKSWLVMVDKVNVVSVVVVFNKAGLTVVVCSTLEVQAVAASAPTNTDVHVDAGEDGKPAHKTPSSHE